MPILEDGLNIMADALAAAATHAQLHTGDPGAAGASNVSTAARQAIAWDAADNGDISLTGTEAFTGGETSGACTHVSLWTASTDGTCLATIALTGDQAFNADGEYTLSDITINGAAA